MQQQINLNDPNYIQIVINQVRNPLYLGRSPTSIIITSYDSNNNMIDQISSGINGQSTQTALITLNSMTSMSKIVGTANSFTFTISPQTPFYAGGDLQFVFPLSFTFSTISCNSIFGLESIDSSPSCSRTNQKVKTEKYYYPSTTQSIIIVLSGIINPFSVKPTDPFLIQTYDQNKNMVCQYLGDSSGVFTALPGTLIFNNGYPQRSSNQANTLISLTLSFKLATQIERNGLIQISINNKYI